jgi:tetratricopeptide (TPR) repeat protein
VTGAVWGLASQLKISEHNKNLAQERLNEIKNKASLYAQTLEGRKLAEMSEQELKTLIREKEEKEKLAALQHEENRIALEVANASIVVEKAERAAAEARARNLEKQLEAARNTAPPPPPLATGLQQAPTSTQPVNILDIQKELESIEAGFKQDFSQANLMALSMPRKALDLLEKRIDDTVSVLMKAPRQSARGWMLLGYLRLAALEFKSAAECFKKALEVRPSIDPAAHLRDFALQNSQTRPVFGKDGPAIADPLRQIHDKFGLSLTTANAISFFTSKPQMSVSIAPSTSPMKRDASNNEIALELLMDNDLTAAPIVKSVGQTKDLEVTLEGTAKDLSTIASQTASLTIRNAQQVDYQSLLNFTKLTHLDLSGSALSDQPPLPRSASRLTHLGLANTKTQSLEFATATPMLVSLDVGGCQLENIQSLPMLRNLRELTISPELLANPKDLALLKSTAITFIRTPSDPKKQPRADFFRKYLPSNQD